jgi:hypothetical protein
MAVATVRTEHNIFLPQMCTDTSRDGFLPNIRVAGPVNQSLLARFCELQFGLPHQLHRPVEIQQDAVFQPGLGRIRSHGGLLFSRSKWFVAARFSATNRLILLNS